MTFASGDLAGLVCAVIVALATNSLSMRVLMIGNTNRLPVVYLWLLQDGDEHGHDGWQFNVVVGVGSADVRVRELAERQLLLLSIRIRVLSYDKYFFS